MIVQKSYSHDKSVLYLVPTPIGNFADMTYRAVDVLTSVDYIYAEDTRVTKILLSHFNISTKLYSYHNFNEQERAIAIIKHLEDGRNIALVSDAGLPLISDPGFVIAKKAIECGFTVISLPGANAALTALVASGIPAEKFLFYGFLDHKITQKEKELTALENYPYSLCFYESPLRLIDTLNCIKNIMGSRYVVIARELTKKYEEYIRGNVDDILENISELKGEIVLIVKAAEQTKEQEKLSGLTIKEHYNFYIGQKMETKEAMKLVAKDRKISKSEVYKNVL